MAAVFPLGVGALPVTVTLAGGLAPVRLAVGASLLTIPATLGCGLVALTLTLGARLPIAVAAFLVGSLAVPVGCLLLIGAGAGRGALPLAGSILAGARTI